MQQKIDKLTDVRISKVRIHSAYEYYITLEVWNNRTGDFHTVLLNTYNT